VGATITEASHDELRAAGIEPVTVDALTALAPQPFRHVLFSAPPRRRSSEPGAYAAAVANALGFWVPPGADGGRAGASFVFTSSASVFAEDSGGTVDEGSPLSSSASAGDLLAAEEHVLQAGGTVLRYGGLYDVGIGPHAYWLKVGVVKGRPDGLINFVHYDDAAAAAALALRAEGQQGKVFVVADGVPVTRAEICESAVKARPFVGSAAPVFEAPPEGEYTLGGAGSGKVLDARRAREALRWTPRHASFPEFMAGL